MFNETTKSDWDASLGFPVEYNWTVCDETTEPMERDDIMSCKEIDVNLHFLVNKVCHVNAWANF